MADHLDPQVQSSIISAFAGAVFGTGGVWQWFKRRAVQPSAQDHVCKTICRNMVAVVEGMLDVMEALSIQHPGMNTSLVKVRVEVEKSREYLDQSEGGL